MTAWNRSLFILAVCGALTAWGCGDDSTGTPDGSTPDGGTPDGTTSDAAPDAPMCTPASDYFTGADNCLNADDGAAAMREDFGEASDESASDVAARCGRGCFIGGSTGAALVTCTTECFQGAMGTDGAFTAECASCYSASVACSADNCAAMCLSAGEACDMCRAGMNDCSINCSALFFDCSGFDPPTP